MHKARRQAKDALVAVRRRSLAKRLCRRDRHARETIPRPTTNLDMQRLSRRWQLTRTVRRHSEEWIPVALPPIASGSQAIKSQRTNLACLPRDGAGRFLVQWPDVPGHVQPRGD